MVKPDEVYIDPQNRLVTVVRLGEDASGPYAEVRLSGSYGAHFRLPLSCLRRVS